MAGEGSTKRDDTPIATAVRIGELGRDMAYVREAVDKIDEKVSNGYVTKEEFAPIKQLVYGVVSLVTIAVIGALLELIIRGGK